ncbi:MAG: hypothetical protein ACRDMU_06435 [Gaiellaceae bacterium]
MTDERVAAVRAALDAARDSWGDSGEAVLDTGRDYVPGEPVEVVARKRGRRWDFGDGGRAVRLAGKPAGWLGVAERVVAEEGMNVNRAGVVFVPAFERSCRDLAALALRLGDVSHAVHAELLELD